MKEEIANLVHPVIMYGLNLKDRIRRNEAGDMYTEQATLKGLLLSDLEARRYADFGGDRVADLSLRQSLDPGRRQDTFLGVRYALACWLDEIFIAADSPWAMDWENNKLETQLYGTNDRAWLFWEQAKKAESRPGGDALEVFFLLVMLGFRGEYLDQPDRLQAWVSATQARIAKLQGQEMQLPPELEPPTNVPPRYGRERMERMVFTAAGLTLILIPVVSSVVVLKVFQ